MSRNQLRKPTPIVRPSSDRNPSQGDCSPARWAPPKSVLQNLSRLSNSPIGTGMSTSAEPSTPNFKSLISDFLGTGSSSSSNNSKPVPSTSGVKFQFKTVSSNVAGPSLPEEPVSRVEDDEVGEDGQMFGEESEEALRSPRPETSFMDYGLSKSPFQSQRNPVSCPSAPKVPRLNVQPVERNPSDDISQQVEQALKECGFGDGTQLPEEVRKPPRKSFTQDIVTGLLNSQSDFFETQMGRGGEEVSGSVVKVPPVKTFCSVGTMTDAEGNRGLDVEHVARQKKSLQTIVANLNRANDAIVKFMTQMQRSCSKTSR